MRSVDQRLEISRREWLCAIDWWTRIHPRDPVPSILRRPRAVVACQQTRSESCRRKVWSYLHTYIAQAGVSCVDAGSAPLGVSRKRGQDRFLFMAPYFHFGFATIAGRPIPPRWAPIRLSADPPASRHTDLLQRMAWDVEGFITYVPDYVSERTTIMRRATSCAD